MFGVGPMEMLILLVPMLGLGGAPLGMPPLPEDPLAARIAPEKCLWYLSSAGVATPQADSKNTTERLLAEPEIAGLYDKIEQQILKAVRRGGNDDPRDNLRTALFSQVIRMLLTRPLAAYISEFKLPGEEGSDAPQIKGGLLVDLGDRAGEFQKLMDSINEEVSEREKFELYDETGVTWHKFPIKEMELAWGIRGRYLILGLGPKEGAELIARAKNNPPAWLTSIRSRLPVERVSVITYLNLAGAVESAGPALQDPQVAGMMQMFGADKFKTIISVSGLEGADCVSRTLLELTGEPSGLIALAAGQPLQADDLAHIPADATIALAMRLSAEQIFEWFTGVLAQVNQGDEQTVFEQGLKEVQEISGIDIQKQLLPALGDVWTLSASPADGGFPFTGAVATVSVKDAAGMKTFQEKLVQVLRANLPDPPENQARNYTTLRSIKVGAETVYYLNIVERDVPFSPAWCLTKDRLLLALYPQSIKGMLSVSSADKRLPDLPAVAARLKSTTPPIGLTYIDTRAVFQTVYPAVQIGLQVAASNWQREGFGLDVSVLPAARTIEKYLEPSVMSYARVKDGLEVTSRQTVPSVSLSGVLPVLGAASFPAVFQARASARRVQDMNSLKQLSLGLLIYENSQGTLPTAQWGKEGNKGLSWRVAMLPYLDRQDLFEQFKLDEPWDSEHNLKLIEKMPEVFRSASMPATAMEARPARKVAEGETDELKYDAYRTRFVTLRHATSVFPPDAEKGLSSAGVTDGTSNTLALVQVAPERAVIWTKPDDLNFNPEDPLAGLCRPSEFFLAAMCDGAVRQIAGSISKEVLAALVSRNGGEDINPGDLHGAPRTVPRDVPAGKVEIKVAPRPAPPRPAPPRTSPPKAVPKALPQKVPAE